MFFKKLKSIFLLFFILIGSVVSNSVSANTAELNATIVLTNGSKIELSQAYLNKFSKYDLTLETPWFKGGPQTFSGVHFKDILAALNVPASATLKVIAFNDYKTEIPAKDVYDYDMLLASHRNGVKMPLRDKGPFFLLYPFDKYPKLNTAAFYSKCPWQIKEIRVEY